MNTTTDRTPGLARTVLGVIALWLNVAVPVAASLEVPEPGIASDIAGAMAAPCDPNVLIEHLDFDRLMERAIADVDAAENIKHEFSEGIRRGFDLASETCNHVEAGGSYTLLRVRPGEHHPQALFRLISGEGVNYHELMIDGEKIVDIYVFSNGEWLSEIVRRGFLPLAARLSGGSVDGVHEDEYLYLDNLGSILEMIRLYREQSYVEALEVFNAFPDELKAHRTVLMQRFAIALKVGGNEYHRAMSDLKRAFPDDPALGLVLVDYHFNRGEFETSLQIIDRLDEQVGGDPYLDFFRASVLLASGRLDDAKRAAHDAIDGDPGLEDPYWTLVTISLEQKNFAETARLLGMIESGLGLQLATDLGEFPEYGEFVASDAYAAWMEERAPANP